MTRRSVRAALQVSDSQRQALVQTLRSRTVTQRERCRARVLLAYADGRSPAEICRMVGVSRTTVYQCIDRALATGVACALRGHGHRAHGSRFEPGAKAWLIGVARRAPQDFGVDRPSWSISALAAYVARAAAAAGFPRLASAGRTTLWRILGSEQVADSEQRAAAPRANRPPQRPIVEVLVLHQWIRLVPWPTIGRADAARRCTLHLEEAFQGQASNMLSLLSALDLHTGCIELCVRARHDGAQCAELLASLDRRHDRMASIRVVLDDLPVHASREVMAFLTSRPGRFEFIHATESGAWLDLIEAAQAKLQRALLGGLGAVDGAQVEARLRAAADELNAHPVTRHWARHDAELVRIAGN